MAKLTVEHYLDIYKLRMEMQEEGITNPPQNIKDFTKEFVRKLSKMELSEEIILEGDNFYDSQKKLIIKFPEEKDFNFFKITMPESRKADFQLGCLDSCVFIDFNYDYNNLIYIKRISFDGFGCCEIKEENQKKLDKFYSYHFAELMKKEELKQSEITPIVLKLIFINKDNIWNEALNEYGLI